MSHINEIDLEVSGYLSAIGVTFKPAYVVAVDTGGWAHDLFTVAVTREGAEPLVTPYKLGLGYRVSHCEATTRGLAKVYPRITRPYALIGGGKRVYFPTPACILHGLLLDATANGESFLDWCDSLGCSSDSIKDLAVYNACCETARSLRTIFSNVQLEELRELLQDY